MSSATPLPPSTPRLEDLVLKLFLGQTDILSALVAHEFLTNDPSFPEVLSPRRQALFEAWVIAYARPFVKSSGRLPPDWPGYTQAEWQAKHERLVDLRQEFVAHSKTAPRAVMVSSSSASDFGARLTIPFYEPWLTLGAEAMMKDLLDRIHAALDVAGEELVRRERKRTGNADGPLEFTIPRS